MLASNNNRATKHRSHLKEKYNGYKIIPITKQYFEETEYSEDEGLIECHTVGFNDHEHYKLIAINAV